MNSHDLISVRHLGPTPFLLHLAGYAVFLFDYLRWGGSEGSPRQVVAPRLHVQDYLAAVKHIQASMASSTRELLDTLSPSHLHYNL